jgi:metal-sulfur cluster biosynthetic enzyme
MLRHKTILGLLDLSLLRGAKPAFSKFALKEARNVTVDVVRCPPWEPSKISKAAKFQLGFMQEKNF